MVWMSGGCDDCLPYTMCVVVAVYGRRGSEQQKPVRLTSFLRAMNLRGYSAIPVASAGTSTAMSRNPIPDAAGEEIQADGFDHQGQGVEPQAVE